MSSINSKYTFESPCPQQFSLPSTIMFYLQQSASALETLYKTCKYFFFKNNLLIIQSPTFNDYSWPKAGAYSPSKILQFRSKLWLTGNLRIEYFEKFPLFDMIIPKLHVYEISSLNLEKLHLYMSAYEFLISSKKLKKLSLTLTVIYYTRKKLVPIDVLLEKVPNITEFFYWRSHESPPEIISNQTITNMINHNRIKKLKSFRLIHFILSDDFEIEQFFNFVNKNGSNENARFECCVTFNSVIQELNFATALRNSNFPWSIKNPSISFTGENFA